MELQPLFDRVVVKQQDAQTQTLGGIILPSQLQEKPQVAVVVAVGEKENGQKFSVKVGDKIIYSKYSGIEYSIKNENLTIIRELDIIAKINN